jgi:hypothetical protein
MKSTFDHPSDGYIDDPDVVETNETESTARLPASPRYMPIEANNARRQQIEADLTIDPQHLDTLDGLKLLLASEEEKTRVFLGLDQEGRDILENLLEVAIGEIEQKHATVVGVVNVLILRMLDIRGALRRGELHLLM